MREKYIVTENENGIDVKTFLRQKAGYSARIFKSAKYYGSIKVNGKEVFSNHILYCGDILETELPEKTSPDIVPVNIPLDVLYEDKDLLAVNKKAFMPVHPSIKHRDDTLANALMYYYRENPVACRILTRLDADTTGVVIAAKNALAAAKFKHKDAKKTYLALCVGEFSEKEGIISAPISRDEGIIKRKVDFISGKEAATEYKVVSYNKKKNLSLVEAVPVTGRTHQIRLHTAHIGHPVYGDFLYGEEIKGERMRLHCKTVEFVHPITDEKISVCAQTPDDFGFYFDF
ncbi:MAG: RluA family pseudouridine synthase [Clostridia bacterium]|nr:RluA family pseudouridine synthase [Clostridia bacterium]